MLNKQNAEFMSIYIKSLVVAAESPTLVVSTTITLKGGDNIGKMASTGNRPLAYGHGRSSISKSPAKLL